jgi:hypothetical protein
VEARGDYRDIFANAANGDITGMSHHDGRMGGVAA